MAASTACHGTRSEQGSSHGGSRLACEKRAEAPVHQRSCSRSQYKHTSSDSGAQAEFSSRILATGSAHCLRRGAPRRLPNRTGEALNAHSRDHLVFPGLAIVSEDAGGACRHGAGRGNAPCFSSTPTRFAVKSEREVSEIARIGFRDRRQGRKGHRRRRERCALAGPCSQRVAPRPTRPLLLASTRAGVPTPYSAASSSLARSVPADDRSRIRNGQTLVGASLESRPAEAAEHGGSAVRRPSLVKYKSNVSIVYNFFFLNIKIYDMLVL